MEIAYQAFLKYKKQFPERMVKDPVLSDEQKYFIHFAATQRSKKRLEKEIQLLKTDSHSPDRWRVDGPLRNMDSFYEAFQIEKGSPMYLEKDKRVSIW